MKLSLTEAYVTKQCIDLLRYEGWRCIRRHVGTFYPKAEVEKRIREKQFDISKWTPVLIGEPGDPDWIVLKAAQRGKPTVDLHGFDLELKRTSGGRLSKVQQIRHVALRKDGFDVCVGNGIDYLREWLEERDLISRRFHQRYSRDPLGGRCD